LLGAAPPIAENIYDFDATVPVRHILSWTEIVADASGGIRRLIIMCHGYVASDTLRGGYGLQFGKDDINFGTAPLFGFLRGKVKAIILYSCSSLDVDVRHGQSGLMLWSQVAFYAQCNVVGSNVDQIYTTNASNLIDFSTWEGQVLMVYPNGNHIPIDPNVSLSW
jgi:hypothetical protein